MIYLLSANYKEWAEKHGIEPVYFVCSDCKKSFLTTVPVYSQLSYGLAIPDHGCDLKSRCHVLVPRDKETKDMLNEFLNKNGISEE